MFAYGIHQRIGGPQGRLSGNATLSSSPQLWGMVPNRLFEAARVLQTLDMRSQVPDQEPLSSADPSMKQDAQTAQSLYDLVLQLASATCWSQLHYTLRVPHCFVQVLLPHHDHMQDVQAFLQKVGVKLGKVEEARKRIAGRGPEASCLKSW